MTTVNKIQTFKFSPPRSDIFLDLKHAKSTIEVANLERTTPKLYLASSAQKFLARFKSKLVQTLKDFGTFLRENVAPKLSCVQLCGELVLSNLILVLCLPIILLWIILLLLIRWGVTVYLRKYEDKYTLMNGSDAAWGLKKFAQNNCFVSIYIVEGDCSLDKIRERIQTSLIDKKCESNSEQFVYQKMRSKIVKKCGFFCWERNDDEFDIKNHIKFLPNSVNKPGGMYENEVLMEMQNFMDHEIHGPEELPQWIMYVVPEFKYKDNKHNTGSNKYAIIWRINHSIMDGVSAINALQTAISDRPVKLTIDVVNFPIKISFGIKCLIYLKILCFGARSFIKSFVGEQPNCFHGQELIGPKTLSWSRGISTQSLKQIKNVMGSSTTAVLLSSFGGALKKLAMRKNLPVPAQIMGGMTSAMVPYPNYGPQNRFTAAACQINLQQECPLMRLKGAVKSVNEFGSAAEVIQNFNLIQLTGLNPVILIKKLMGNLKATFILSNVPGPSEHYTFFEGDKMIDIVAWNTIKGKTGIGICLLSYAGKIRAGLVTDAAVLPNPVDVEYLMQDFESEISDLAKICGISDELVFE